MYISQKYRIYPNQKQSSILNQWLGQGRFVWNHMLDLNIKTYKEEQRFVFVYGMNNLLPDLKKTPETSFLKEIPSQCLQQKCSDLDKALKQSSRKAKNKKGFPKFKAKKLDESGIRFPTFKFEGDRIILPKMVGGIKIKLHRPLLGKKGSLTLTKDKLGRYFVSILVAIDDPEPINEINNAIGIDVGLKSFAVTSDGEVIDNPKFYKKTENKLTKLQRQHSKKLKGSNNREKSRLRLAKQHKKVANQRKDFINQVASSIAKNNDLIAVEDLNVKGMVKNHKLAKSIHDVGWGMFLTALEWQCLKRGKHFVKISRWFPSSKTCSNCGVGYDPDLTLNDRVYVCPDCGFGIDRDLNAAFNILNEGLRIHQNTVGTTEINACGNMKKVVMTSAQEASGSLVHK